MKTLLIAVLLLGSGAAGALSAAEAPRDRNNCPERGIREDGKAYGVRIRDYCEFRWTDVLAARQAGGQTHDEFVDGCLRRCVSTRSAMSGAPLGWILGGLWTGTLVNAVTEGSGGGRSATPPASP